MMNQRTLFPEPAIETREDQGLTYGKGQRQRTFSVYPQEGVSGLPLTEYTALVKPLRCPIVMGFACNVMVCGWIWWG